MAAKSVGTGARIGLTLAILAVRSWAVPGDLDTDFGSGGIVTFPGGVEGSGSSFSANAVDEGDGRLVAAGELRFEDTEIQFHFAVAAFLSNGTPDTSFGSGGLVTTEIVSNGIAQATAVIVLDDESILVGGHYHDRDTNTSGFAVAKYNPDGSLDDTNDDTPLDEFGSGGIAKFELVSGSSALMGGMAIQTLETKMTEEYVVLAGTVQNPAQNVTLVRCTLSGAIDTGFGSAGIALEDFDESNMDVSGVVIDASGQIVVGGTATDPDTLNAALAAARFTPGGAPDADFSEDGLAIAPITGMEFTSAGGVALQPGIPELIVVVGSVDAGDPCGLDSDSDAAVARFTDTGAVDSSFGSGGTVVTPIGPCRDDAEAVAVQPNGKIVVAGHVDVSAKEDAYEHDYFVLRYNADGTPDSTFKNGSAFVTTDLGSTGDNGRAVGIQQDGKIVIVGETNINDSGDGAFGLVRYDGNEVTAAPKYRPDAQIEGKGDNIYNKTGKRQNRKASVLAGKKKSFTIVVQNDGQLIDSFTVRGADDSGPFRVRYEAVGGKGTNISAAVKNGSYTIDDLKPSESVSIKMTVSVDDDAEAGEVETFKVRATSVSNKSKLDVVKAIVTTLK